MKDEILYNKILGLTKGYLRSSVMLRALEAEEVANTAFLYMKQGKYGLKEDGNPYYAVQYAVNPSLKGNIHVRAEGVHLSYNLDFFKSLENRDTTDMVEVYDAIDTLPEPQFLALCRNIEGRDCNKQDLEAGQKAMRDIYDS